MVTLDPLRVETRKQCLPYHLVTLLLSALAFLAVLAETSDSF
jgi:hypothetical protein